MRSRENAAPTSNMNDFSRLCPLQTPAWKSGSLGVKESGILFSEILKFWNSGILEYVIWNTIVLMWELDLFISAHFTARLSTNDSR